MIQPVQKVIHDPTQLSGRWFSISFTWHRFGNVTFLYVVCPVCSKMEIGPNMCAWCVEILICWTFRISKFRTLAHSKHQNYECSPCVCVCVYVCEFQSFESSAMYNSKKWNSELLEFRNSNICSLNTYKLETVAFRAALEYIVFESMQCWTFYFLSFETLTLSFWKL